jgi:hypothetical protein
MQIWPEKRRAMLTEKYDETSDGQDGEQEVDAKVSEAIHQGLGIVA